MSSLLARTVHLIVSVATLLSGGLEDCLTASDASCVGGVAAVSAFARNGTGNDPTLVLPFFDNSSPFVQRHPLGWNVNRLVLEHIMGWSAFLATPSLLMQNSGDFNISSRDLSDLQSSDFPLLLSNVVVPPSNSWFPYTTPIFFDDETGLAVISIVDHNQAFNIPQVEATLGILDYVERINQRAGCTGDNTESSLLDQYMNRTTTERKCWIPIVIFADIHQNFIEWLDPVLAHDHKPSVIVNLEESMDEYSPPFMVQGIWVVSYQYDRDLFSQVTIEIGDGGRVVTGVEHIQTSMEFVPEDLKDSTYIDQITALRSLADEAMINDPIVGQSVAIPVHREDAYRRCEAGECEIGNLFNDAIRWYTQSDVGFQASGGYRGLGWEAGAVKVSDIWNAFPFDNTLCTGVISGVSLFRLFNYSMTYSTFEGEHSDLGDRLLQVSGLRISYNLQLESTSRLVKMEVWNEADKSYTEVDRLGLYKFVTDSYVCFGFEEYPMLLGAESLTLQGEIPGAVADDIIIQAVVADYLSQLELPYDPSLLGSRLINRTDVEVPLNLIETPDSCSADTYWQANLSSCVPCPNQSIVTFLSEKLEFQANELSSGKPIKLVNPALFDVMVQLKSSPSWVSVASVIFETSGRVVSFTNSSFLALPSGESLIIYFQIEAQSLESGTAQGVVVLEVDVGGEFLGCTTPETSFEILARKFPPKDLNQLGSLRYVGITMACIAGLSSLCLAVWVVLNRKIQVVRILQPTFLATITMGVFVMSLALIPMSIDDEIASQRVNDISCMSIPWLLSLGFSFAMSALFAKLWRIDRLFRATAQGRRVNIGVKDVIGPIALMIVLNAAVLLSWTLVSPLRFQRRSVENEPWNSYGVCESNNKRVGRAMLISVIVINMTCLAFASYMAYRVRNVSDEFSESKRVGLALFCWVQLLLVAGPMMFLIDEDNPSAKYFLETGVIFAVCVSMLCFIFVPIIWLKEVVSQQPNRRNTTAITNGYARTNDELASQSSRLSKPFTLRDKGVHISGIDFAGQDFISKERSSDVIDTKPQPLVYRDDFTPSAVESLGVVDEAENPEDERPDEEDWTSSNGSRCQILSQEDSV